MNLYAETVECIRSISADGRVSYEELETLANHLNEDREARTSWPGVAVFEVLKDILADGKVEQHELEGLAKILSGIEVICSGHAAKDDKPGKDAKKKRMRILAAEDSATDRELLTKAFAAVNRNVDLSFVKDGQELTNRLMEQRPSDETASASLPDLILLDLNLPRKDGKQVLRELPGILGDSNIPVVVLTGSKNDRDLLESFELGALSYFEKPFGFAAWKQLVRKLGEFWVIS